MAVTGKTVTVKASVLKKKAKKLPVSKTLKFTKAAQGTKSYSMINVKKAKAKKYFTIKKTTGVITIKKGLKKGKYTVKIKVTASGNKQYKSGSKDVVLTVKVK